jgi:hypothetical protein
MDENLTLGMQCKDVNGNSILVPHRRNFSISGWVQGNFPCGDGYGENLILIRSACSGMGYYLTSPFLRGYPLWDH